MLKIDKKDKRLIFELRRNCRQTYAQLAKTIRTSKQMVQYRIRRLSRMGVLGEKELRIDAGRLGFHNFGVYFQWDDDSFKDAFVRDVLKDKAVRYAAECSGRVDFVIAFYAKSATDFQLIWDKYSAKYGASIRSHSIHVSTENRAFDKSYLFEVQPRERAESFLGSAEKTVQTDESDLAILKALSKDCRTSIVSIAEECDLAPETVRSRIKRMEKEGLIQGYGWLFNLEPLGITLYELLLSLTNMDSKKWKELRAYCRSNPNITYFIRSIGAYDASIVFEVKSEADFDRQLRELRKLFSRNISDFEIAKIVKEHVFRYAPSL